MSKFKIAQRPAVSVQPSSAEEFAARADLVQTQTTGRPPKPVRVNFDVDPELHRRLKIRAIDRGISVAELVRGLIERDLGR